MALKDQNKIPLQPVGAARLPTDQLRRLSAAVPPITDPLHLVHITAAGWACEMLRSPIPQIETRRCDVFGRQLAYFFVARAAFRPRNGDVGAHDVTPFPVALVIDPTKLGAPAHVYPFDTGAAATGRYPGAYQSGVFLQDYALEPNIEAVRHLIAWGFKTYSEYLKGQINPDLEQQVGHQDYVARAFLRIARLASVGSNQPDLRASAIEVAFASHIPLEPYARFAVLPEQLLEFVDQGMKLGERLTTLRIPFHTYRWVPGETPDRHMEDVRRIVATWIASQAHP